MKASVIVFPGSNCDRDVAVALEAVTGKPAQMIWHQETEIPESDLIVLPGGFSYGDYLRCGAIAAHSPIMRDVITKAKQGVALLGICNGFQMLTETRLLPGVLMRNTSLKFICKDVSLKVERTDTPFAKAYDTSKVVTIPVAHHDGNFFTDDDTLNRIEAENQVAFRYCDHTGAITTEGNPNGSLNNIAGIYDKTGRILGMMPHPERLIADNLGGTDGKILFQSLVESLAA